MSSISLCYLEDGDCWVAFNVMCELVGEKNYRFKKELDCAKAEIASLRASVLQQKDMLERKEILLLNKEE